MDDVERLYRHLVRTIRSSYPQFMSEPFEVGELYQTILPYRLHRRELGFETNQDYELAMLELLSGARGFLVVDDRMRDVLAKEQSAIQPDPAVIKQFASSHVALAPEPLRRLLPDARPGASGAPTPGASGAYRASGGNATIGGAPPTPSAGVSVDSNPRRVTRPITVPEGGDACPYCKGDLPGGRQISFCPHCGQDLTMVHCPACGSELERGWKFCVACGRSAAAP